MHGWQDGAAVGAETEKVGREVLRVCEDEAGPWGAVQSTNCCSTSQTSSI